MFFAAEVPVPAVVELGSGNWEPEDETTEYEYEGCRPGGDFDKIVRRLQGRVVEACSVVSC